MAEPTQVPRVFEPGFGSDAGSDGPRSARRQNGRQTGIRLVSALLRRGGYVTKSESATAVAVTGLKVEREAPGRPVTEDRDVSLCLFRTR
jgi:hypothetical protein